MFTRIHKLIIAGAIVLFVLGEYLLIEGSVDPTLRQSTDDTEYSKYFVASFINLIPICCLGFYIHTPIFKTGIPYFQILVFSTFTVWIYEIVVESLILKDCNKFDYNTNTFYHPHCVNSVGSEPIPLTSSPSQYFIFTYIGIIIEALFCLSVLLIMHMIDNVHRVVSF